MPVSEIYLMKERQAALLEILEQSGVAPDHVAALRETESIGSAAEVAAAHKNGNAPPDTGGGNA